MSLKLKIKVLNDKAVIPTQAHKGDAGLDLTACYYTMHNNNGIDFKLYNQVTIKPHETIMVGTGLAMEIPEGYFGGIFPRSGLSTKKGLRCANCVAVIDEPYRGEVMIPIHNDSDKPKIIKMGERVAQLILLPYQNIDIETVDNLSDTERGAGGFGSTGV